MSSKTKTAATTVEARAALVPKLRFPEFRAAEGWKSGKVDDLVDTVTPPKKLPTTAYALSGAFPVIDQSQSDICGWTDDAEALIHEDLPLIVFGDHTCILKLITRPFAQGADGIKILKTRPRVETTYLYQFLSYRPVVTEEYKRHFSILKEKIVFFPELKSGEQQKIAECLSSLDELMAAQAQKVDALKTHKRGLMQQLFPREGETQPRFRFPEFQSAGEWEPVTLENVCAAKISYGIVQAGPHVPNGMPYIKSTDLNAELSLANLSRTSAAIAQKYRRSEVVPGDIVFSLRGNIGVARIVPEGIPVANLTQGTARIRTKGPPEFYFHALRSPTVLRRILAVGKGSTFQEISLEALRNIGLSHPKPAEQHRIASCLSSLDALITAETQKHESLKIHKKGLMQQLFPSLGEEK